MNQLFSILADVSKYNPALPPLNDEGTSYAFTWVIICVFVALVMLVTFKSSNRQNAD